MPPRGQYAAAVPAPVSRDDYVEAGLALLGEAGPAGLRLGALVQRLGVTTGSFYHHFDGMAGFRDVLLSHWEASRTAETALLAQAATEVAPDLGIAVLREAALALPHAAERAIRAWSHQDPAVGAVQRRVDDGRRASLRGTIERVVGDAAAAAALADLGTTLLIGFQQGGDVDRLEVLGALLDDYERLIRLHAAA